VCSSAGLIPWAWRFVGRLPSAFAGWLTLQVLLVRRVQTDASALSCRDQCVGRLHRGPYAGKVTYPANSPVVAVRAEKVGEQYRIEMRRADGEVTTVHGASVIGGLRYPGDLLVHFLAHGVSMEDAAHCIEELEPGFDAKAELVRRSEIDMAASRLADRSRRDELKAQFRRERGS
jgi:hypothetical protein